MSRLLKTTGSAASLAALFFMLGGHWMMLQSVAWARMLAAYSEVEPLREAMGKTFGGQYPCDMCHSIRGGRQQEEREQQTFPLLKNGKSSELYCIFRQRIVPFAPMNGVDAIAFVPVLLPDFVESPPLPPPRNSSAVV